VADHLKLGDIVRAKVLEVDRQGRVRLSIKEAIRDEQGEAAPATEPVAPVVDATVEQSEE
jgi:polyribonucleotide nucleotidyltransferase